MTKKFQQWAYALAAGVIALTMCFSISACSSDNDDNNGGDGISPVLFSDFNGTIGVNYPLGFTGQFVGFSIPKSMADCTTMMTISSRKAAMSIFARPASTR